MAPPIGLLELLACPRCDRALDAASNGLRCSGCRIDFPLVDGEPWLFAEPQAALDEWQGRLRFTLLRIERERERVQASLDGTARDSTRSRLSQLASALADHRARLAKLLAPFALDGHGGNYETYLALRTRLPPDQGLTTYYPNIHRDWGWGETENVASLELVAASLAAARHRTLLVLGAGAGRLAYDLHGRCGPEATIALDFNPLLVTIARRAARGETIELYEFPLAPRTRADQAVLRRLQAPAPAAAGLRFLLADAHRPPFRKGAFSAVITPWLVDILPEPFEAQCARVNGLLESGGQWVNFGSLAFPGRDPAGQYGIDECVDVLTEHGFDEIQVDERDIPYLCSPASRHARRERVVIWSATKRRDVKRVARYQALPDWLVRGTDAVPLTESFRSQALSTRVHAFIMSLIDGRRSLKDIAATMVEQRLLAPTEAEGAIRSFLVKMHDDAQRGQTY